VTKRLFIPNDWKEWIAMNLLRGLPREHLTKILVENDFPELLAKLEVETAASHPYLRAARRLIGPTKKANATSKSSG
jgi:hypothetical protein